MRLVGQPAVIGEMIAGLALGGPSLLGAVAPGAMQALFPTTKMLPLATLSQLGVVLFMFVLGLRIDLSLLRGKASAAVAVSHIAAAAIDDATAWCILAAVRAVANATVSHGASSSGWTTFVITLS